MSEPRSDALAFFGATGDLAYKKISRRCMRWRGAAIFNSRSLESAKSGWNLDQLRAARPR